MTAARRARRAQRPSGPWLLATAVLVVAPLVGARLTEDDSDARSAGDITLDAYEVVYRINELGDEREERIAVRLPYESYRSSQRAGGLMATIINDDGQFELASDRTDGWLQIDPGRRRGEGDTRLLGGLELLVDIGLAERRPDGTILGRVCQTFRVAEPVGIVATREPTAQDHVDLCIDEESGVLLTERWVATGKVVRTREAIRLDFDPPFDEELFDPVPLADDRPTPNRREVPLTDGIHDDLAVTFDLPDSIVDDGGTAIVEIGLIGQPVGGTVRRFLRRGNEVVDVEEVEVASLNLDGAVSHAVPIGSGYIESDVRLVTLSVVWPTGVAIRLRGPDIDIVDDVARAMRLTSP